MKAKRGFTLIEMLTVIVIIAILATITMKMMVYVNQKTGRARASGEIERIKHALTEFYAVYGCFPPTTSGMLWEFENPKYPPAADPINGKGYKDGLAKYLFADPEQGRWEKYITGLDYHPLIEQRGSKDGFSDTLIWTNNGVTINDPWERSYEYITVEPFQTFKLFSRGPDGQTNTVDDVGDKWTE
jgi:prepilin-type N-terminal cleavage/methylation domain-containing protein